MTLNLHRQLHLLFYIAFSRCESETIESKINIYKKIIIGGSVFGRCLALFTSCTYSAYSRAGEKKPSSRRVLSRRVLPSAASSGLLLLKDGTLTLYAFHYKEASSGCSGNRQKPLLHKYCIVYALLGNGAVKNTLLLDHSMTPNLQIFSEHTPDPNFFSCFWIIR
jgi:hypothetical protein